ncbi:MAG: response regulator [archaeon]
MANIYIVDDEVLMRKVVKRLVDGLGYNTSTFENATQLLESLAKNIPDLVVMDTEMNGLKGYEACKRARQLYGNTFGIIGMSGKEEFQKDWIEAGADAFIGKPFSITEFRDTIKTTLEKYTI